MLYVEEKQKLSKKLKEMTSKYQGLFRYINLQINQDSKEKLGFSVKTSKRGNTIHTVDPNGLAKKAGLIVGDRIIEINEINCEKMKHDEVVNFLQTENLKILVISYDCDPKNAERDEKALEMEEKIFFLKKGEKSFGIGLEIERSRSEDGKLIHKITRVDRGGQAEKAGLFIDMAILKINDLNVEKMTTEDLKLLIQYTG